jgi:hypothetical protein
MEGNFGHAEDCAEFRPVFPRIEISPSNIHMASYADCRGFGLADPAIGALTRCRLPARAQAESED